MCLSMKFVPGGTCESYSTSARMSLQYLVRDLTPKLGQGVLESCSQYLHHANELQGTT